MLVNSSPKFADEICAICRDAYNDEKNECLALKCGHLYHTACVKEYLEKTPSCPSCRAMATFLDKDQLNELSAVSAMHKSAITVKNLFKNITFFLATAWVGTTLGNYLIPGRQEADEAYLAANPPIYVLDTEDCMRALLAIGSISLGASFAYYLAKNQIEKKHMKDHCAQEIIYTPTSS